LHQFGSYQTRFDVDRHKLPPELRRCWILWSFTKQSASETKTASVGFCARIIQNNATAWHSLIQ
jgi:hypothetical protein